MQSIQSTANRSQINVFVQVKAAFSTLLKRLYRFVARELVALLMVASESIVLCALHFAHLCGLYSEMGVG